MPYQNDWWQTFYSGHYIDFHLEIVNKKKTPDEVDFMLKLLQPPPEAKILDLGCGEGRHAIEMAKRGYQVTGVDVTESLLNTARRTANDQSLNVNFEQRDMRDLPWEATFDLAYCVWGSFGIFDEQGNYDLLSAIYKVLKPGGRILIENHSIETLLLNFQTNFWHPIGDDLLHLEMRNFDHKTSRLESRWMFVHKSTGQIENETMSMRIYTYHELCQLLQSVGFDNCSGYDTVSGAPFTFGAQRLTLIATKL